VGVHLPRPAQAMPEYDLERSLFLVAERALSQGNLRSFEVTRQLLTDYPLLPYLDHRKLARNLSLAAPEQIADFISAHSDVPLANTLLNHYLDHLAKESKWSRFLEFSPGAEALSTELGCRHRQALLESGRRTEALADVETIWLHGKSQPKACDPVFRAWRADGRLTRELAWARYQLAVEARETALARYLRRYLADSDRSWADRAVEYESHPERISRSGFSAGQHAGAAWILERAWTRFARQSHEEMLAAWTASARDRSGLDAAALSRIDRALALTLARRGHPDALEFMAGLTNDAVDSDLNDWELRAALRVGDWQRVFEVSARALEGSSLDSRWTYWHARAAESLGQNEQAVVFYRRAATGRDLHAFLAADRVDQPYRINHSPAEPSRTELAAMRDHASMRRMRELVRLDRLPEARREWSHTIPTLTERQQIAAAWLFHEWGWFDRAIFTLARAQFWDDIDIRFPLAFFEPITEGAQAQGIDPAWAMAVARQESAFIADVRSSAGALGLMQIMPNTGRSIADAAGVRVRNDNDILQPTTNTRLGTYYLRRNLDGFGGHSLLSTAAYNAGASRVRSWLPDSGSMDPDIWIELIPFNETRNYVERVFAYQVFYAVRMGFRPRALFTLLYPVTVRAELEQARERHLALYAPADLQLAVREICDAPGYSSRPCAAVVID